MMAGKVGIDGWQDLVDNRLVVLVEQPHPVGRGPSEGSEGTPSDAVARVELHPPALDQLLTRAHQMAALDLLRVPTCRREDQHRSAEVPPPRQNHRLLHPVRPPLLGRLHATAPPYSPSLVVSRAWPNPAASHRFVP